MATQLQPDNVYGVLGGLPVAEQTQDYFIVFKGAGGTGPEIIDNTAYFIEYVVDYEGEIAKPSSDSIARLNLLQNFPIGKTAIVRTDNASSINTQLGGEHLITGVGSQKPILYTQYGIPSSSYTLNLTFSAPNGAPAVSSPTVSDVLGTMVRTSSLNFDDISYTNITNFDDIIVAPLNNANFDSSSGLLILTSSNKLVQTINTFTFKISYNVTNNNSRPAEMIVILKRGTITLSEDIFIIPPNLSKQREFITTIPRNNLLGSPPNSLTQIRIQAQTTTPVTFSNIAFSLATTSPLPPFRTQTNFWSTGSDTNITWLTASSFLSLNHGNIQNTSNFIGTGGSFGLSPITNTFTPRIGDRIRFEYDPSKDYYIYETISPQEDGQGLLKLKLNTTIPDGTNIDNFIIHRVDNEDIKYLILDIVKKSTISDPDNPFTGIILPKYPSERLKNNLDNILSQLKEKNIL